MRSQLAEVALKICNVLQSAGYDLPDDLKTWSNPNMIVKADLIDRDNLELLLQSALVKLGNGHFKQLMEALGDPPNINNIPPGFWDEIGADLRATLAPFLQNIYLEQAKQMLGQLPIGVEWALVNQRAMDWTRAYTFDLVRGINDTTRTALQKAVSAYFGQGLTVGDLEQSLVGLFGPVRSEMIAVTEITRAAARGEDAIAAELREAGIEMITKWGTNNDELVCMICAPLNGQEAAGHDGDMPYWIHPDSGDKTYLPAHVKCRCHENHELPKAKR